MITLMLCCGQAMEQAQEALLVWVFNLIGFGLNPETTP
jgi:hypothetical protein